MAGRPPRDILAAFMGTEREHRSERPAVWDYSNPKAERRVSLRRRLRSGRKKAKAPRGK